MRTFKTLSGSIVAAALLAAPALGQDVTINYMTFSAAPDYIEELEATIAAFEAANPGINVEYETAAWDSYFTKLQTLVASRTAPDAFELNYENFVTYAERGALLDLGPLIEADDGFDTGIYNPTALAAFNLEDKQYGLVESFSNVVLFYNRDLFDAAGVDYPSADWTWEDELEAAKALTDAEAGVWGTFAPLQFWEFYKTVAQNGGAILNEDKTEVVIDSPQNVEALAWMVDKINTHHVTPSDAQMGGQSPEDMFLAGKIAMLRTGIWMFGAFADAPFTWDIALEPGGTNKAHHFFANGVAVSANSDNPEAAYKWIKFLTSSPEAVELRIAAGWELPAVTDQSALEGYLAQPIPESREIVFEALDTAVVPPVIGNWNKLTDAVGKELDEAKLGRKTPEQALTDARAALEGLL